MKSTCLLALEHIANRRCPAPLRSAEVPDLPLQGWEGQYKLEMGSNERV
jgi:hypothetical protein